MGLSNDLLWWLVVALIGIIMAGIAWWNKNMWAMLIEQQKQISALNTNLAGNYVPRLEMQVTFKAIFDKLDEISRFQRDGGR